MGNGPSATRKGQRNGEFNVYSVTTNGIINTNQTISTNSTPATTTTNSNSIHTNQNTNQTNEHSTTTNHSTSGRPARRIRSNEPVTGMISDIFQYYTIERKELGHGHYGVVRVGTNKQDGTRVAIKSILKAKVSDPKTMRREIEILKSVKHPNIIKFYQVFEDSRYLHLVTELCTGGELFDRIISKGHYSERDAAVVVQSIVNAVKHCHDRDICHRDLKPENFLFETPANDSNLKVIDFGLSRIDDGASRFMTTRVGTPYYIAPEVLGRHYDKSCDLWSIGVITYVLLCGYPPFYGDNDPEILKAVRSGKYDFDTPEWTGVSEEAKDLINHLLRLNPSDRLTVDEALAHPWLSGSAPDIDRTMNNNMLQSLKRFNGHNKLKKAALAVIAEQLTEGEINELKATFQKIDTDGNGVVTIAELSAAVRSMGNGMLDHDVTDLLKGIDIDGNGKLDYQEFIAATMKKNLFNKEQHLENAFNYFDTQRQGIITKDDLIRFMGSEEHAQEVIDEVDTNQDGHISFEEFVAMMQKKGMGESSSGVSPKAVPVPGQDTSIFHF